MMTANRAYQDETAQFFEHVFGHVPEGMWFYIWTLPDKLSRWFKSPVEAAGFVSQQHNGHDVYVGIALAASAGKASERVRARDAAGIVGFVADIDFQHKVHNSTKDYPPNLETARAVIDSFPLAPTTLVHSGHGLQAWWLFKEPWIFDSASERMKAQKLAEQWSVTLKTHALRLGYALDSVHDLARVMRVPGTHNNKDEPVLVHIVESKNIRYTPPLDFEEHLTNTELLTSATPALDAEFPLTLDSEASPPQKKLAALLANDERFAATWEHKRHNELSDSSMSGYDMALATATAQQGWRPQEIVDLLIAHRQRYGRHAKHLAYYQTTVGKALATAPTQPGTITKQAVSTNGASKTKQAEQLVRIVEGNSTELFMSETDEAFVQIPVGDHLETWPVARRQLRRWLSREFRRREGKPPSHQAVSEALLNIEGLCAEGPIHKLHNRMAWHNGALYYDLADARWRAVKLTEEGWEIIDKPPILFRRYEHQQPQMEPAQGGDVADILSFLNLPDDEDLKLLVKVYLVSCFLPDIPRPILVVIGPQGSAKTSFCRTLRAIIDPSATGILSFPRDQAELVQQLQHHAVAYFDNVSTMPAWLSDTLCRASTGEGFSKRRLYTDDEDVIYNYKRVVGVNAVSNPATRPDFLDRSIVLNLERMPDKRRRTERELDADFSRQRPAILAACFDALSHAIKKRPTISLPALPRMADFATWGACIAEGLGYSQEDFLNLYRGHISDLNTLAVEGQPFVQAVIELVDNSTSEWRGTASQLLQEATRAAEREGIDTKSRAWPGDSRWASTRLDEGKANLQEIGVDITRLKDRGRRLIVLRRVQLGV